MKKSWYSLAILAAVCVLFPHSTARAVSPYTEEFPANSANWISPDEPATFNASGGPDGSSFINVNRNASDPNVMNAVTLLRGQDALNASSDQFVGNWLSAGISHFSAYVRHEAPVPLSISTRFATSANFPGTTTISTQVQPNTWTQLNYEISTSSLGTTLFPESAPADYVSTFNATFGALGNIQFAFTIPAALAGTTTDYAFGFDKISTTPEPGAALLVVTAMLGGLGIRRRGIA